MHSLAVPIYFAAPPKIGALKSGMVTNVRPVASIAAAYLVFGELLGPVQGAGGVMVLAGLWLAQWHDSRSLRREAAR